MRSALIALIVVTLPFSACVRSSQRTQFERVKEDIHERIGHEIEWDRDLSGALSTREAVDGLLDDGLTVEEAVQVSLLNNPGIQAVYEELGIAQAEVIEAMLPMNPTFEGTYEFLREGGTVAELAFVDDFMALLLIPLKTKLLTAQRQSIEAFLKIEVLKLAFGTRTSFYDHLAAREDLDLSKKILTASQFSYEMACRLRSAGNITMLELDRQRMTFEKAKVRVAMAELELIQSREVLNRKMALWGEATEWYACQDLPGVPDEEWLPVDFESVAIESSLDLTRSRFMVTARERNLDIKNITSLLPRLEAGVEMEIEEGHGWSYIGPTWNFPLPIFDWGGPERAVARGLLRKQWREFTALAIEIRSAVRESRQRLVTARQKALYYESVLVPLQEQVMNQTHLRFNGMLLGVFELLDTKREELSAYKEYTGALRDYWIARAEFHEILNGRLVRATRTKMSMESDTSMDGGNQGDGH